MTSSVSGSVSGTGESGQAEFTEDEADSEVHATLADYSIETDVASAKGPHVFFEIENTGEVEHELVVEKEDGDVLIGEVSTVNDDLTDNLFRDPIGRFSAIAEDEAPLHLLVSDYEKWLA